MAWIFPLVLIPMLGCAHQEGQRSTSGLGGTSLQGTRSAGASLAEARQMVETDQHDLAVPRLLYIIGKHPESPEAIEARFWLGLAYFRANMYQDAIRVFDDYLELAPEGARADQAARYSEAMKVEYAQRFVTVDELEAMIQEMNLQIERDPYDDEAKLKLADLLWKRGDYQSAGAIYIELLNRQPAYMRISQVSDRVERLATGEYFVVTPAEVERRSIENRPLRIVNTNDFRSGEDLLTRERRYYVVSGQAHNRGDSILYGVQVHVTIYGFGNVIFDTATVNMGRLHPGERRAFSVRFSNFDNINHVARYECVGSYER